MFLCCETVFLRGIFFFPLQDSRKEPVHFDKITSRIHKLCYGLNMEFVDPCSIAQKVINGLYPGVTTVELDNLAAETAATMTTKHPDYAILAARIAISNLHKETKKVFSVVERPQHMLMRVSIGIHGDDLEAALDTYNLMSEKWFTHASPTLFNSGTPRPQLSRYLCALP
ncbi:hypothetical protein HPB48_018374 [Haemaphysalis longicornis]|uniref:Ribonucleoside-diphosphate reductase large subunit n=1 Tax=Haemaphysalis longicornis TaxID=44386 RepID=A0A9J6GEY2_HAELO|nr:hypothetical protein HPB48_018374 [Haemaphysalis longicornis]